MGYHGLGMQRWIYTMKPRKFLGKRSKPDGGGGEAEYNLDINSFYHLKPNKLGWLLSKKYTQKQKTQFFNQLKNERKKSIYVYLLSFMISCTLLFILVYYLNAKLGWF